MKAFEKTENPNDKKSTPLGVGLVRIFFIFISHKKYKISLNLNSKGILSSCFLKFLSEPNLH